MFFLAILGAGIYFNIKRYQLVSTAIHSGNTGVALALLAPEIGEGVGSAIGTFPGRVY